MLAVSSQTNNSDSRLIMISVLLSLPLLSTTVVGSALFFCGLPAVPVAIMIGYAAVYGVYFFHSRELKLPLVALLLTLLSLAAASLFYDFSTDGRIHLQESVIQQARGWNPFKNEIPVSQDWTWAEWCNFYPAGFQLIEACIYRLTDSIQTAKGVNFVFLLSALSASLSVMRPLLGSRRAVLASVVLVLNPIVIAQIWTFYIDGVIYLIFLTALCLLAHTSPGRYFTDGGRALDFKGRLTLALILASILILPVIKLSGLAFSGFLYILLAYQFRRRVALIVGWSVAGALLFCLTCFRPYFIYPLPRTITVATISLLASMPQNIIDIPTAVGQLYNYFGTVTKVYEDISIQLFSTDFSIQYHSCAGLYGVIFGLVWLWSIVYLFQGLLRTRSTGGDNALPLFLFVITNLVPIFFPSFMNQRYFPIQYIFPIAMLIRGYLDADSKSKKKAGEPISPNSAEPLKITDHGGSRFLQGLVTAVMALLLINPVGYLADTVIKNILYVSYIKESLKELAERPPQPYLQVTIDSGIDSKGKFNHLLMQALSLSDRLFFKDLGRPIYLPVLVTNPAKTQRRFENGRVSEARPLVAADGSAAIIPLAAEEDGAAPKIVKLSLTGGRQVGFNIPEVVMYVQSDRAAGFGSGMDEYFRWPVDGGDREYTAYLDIPPYARRAVITGLGKVVITGAELREADYPELIRPEDLTLRSSSAKLRGPGADEKNPPEGQATGGKP